MFTLSNAADVNKLAQGVQLSWSFLPVKIPWLRLVLVWLLTKFSWSNYDNGAL